MLLLFAALLPRRPARPRNSSAVAQIETLRLRNGRFDVSDAFRQYGLKTVEAANARIETIIAQSCKMAERAECDAEVRAIILSMLTHAHRFLHGQSGRRGLQGQDRLRICGGRNRRLHRHGRSDSRRFRVKAHVNGLLRQPFLFVLLPFLILFCLIFILIRS